jgi:hypothetical protein
VKTENVAKGIHFTTRIQTSWNTLFSALTSDTRSIVLSLVSSFFFHNPFLFCLHSQPSSLWAFSLPLCVPMRLCKCVCACECMYGETCEIRTPSGQDKSVPSSEVSSFFSGCGFTLRKVICYQMSVCILKCFTCVYVMGNQNFPFSSHFAHPECQNSSHIYVFLLSLCGHFDDVCFCMWIFETFITSVSLIAHTSIEQLLSPTPYVQVSMIISRCNYT